MKVKQIFALVFAVMLLSGVCAPSVLAQDQALLSSKADIGAVVLTRFDEPNRTDAVAFAVGTSQKELSDYFADYYDGFTGYDAQGKSYDLMTGAWSLKNVDTAVPGVYDASAAPDLGNTYILGDGVSLPKQLCAVSIQTLSRPNINCCVSARGFVYFPWVLSSEQQNQLDQFTVMLRKNTGTWETLREGFIFTSGDLQLSQHIFEKGNTYDLQVLYPGGRTGILTFQYDNEFVVVDYSGGDRDGGDVNGGGQSTGTQPAPSSPKVPDNSLSTPNKAPTESASDEPNSTAPTGSAAERAATTLGTESHDIAKEQNKAQVVQNHAQKTGNMQAQASTASQGTSSTVQESYSPTQTVISGLRLRDLCTGEKSVVFGTGNVTVSIPSEQLLALKLADTDTLTVRLTQPEKNTVTLTVDASGSTISELPGTVLRLHYIPQSKNSDIAVYSEDGKKITNTEFDGELLRFTVNTAGTYRISEATAVPKESKAARSSAAPLVPLMGGGLILAGGGTALVRRKCHG
jgi:hypothetical protein